MTWWVHSLYQDGQIVQLLSWLFWVPLAITLHELAHGWAALWQGDDTPRRLDRMTLNPLVHMGPASLVVFLIIGIAWGAMPVDPSKFRWRRKGRIVVAAAGPAMNLLLAVASLLLLVVWLTAGPRESKVYDNAAIFLFTGGWLNVVLCVFNLLPVPPLDGSSILSGLSWRAWRLYQHPQAPLLGLVGLLVLFWVLPFGSMLFVGSLLTAAAAVDLPGAALGSPSILEIMYP